MKVKKKKKTVFKKQNKRAHNLETLHEFKFRMNSYEIWYTVTDFITAELWKYFWFDKQTLGDFTPKK